ncbi:MAG TPA: helix-turn-helix domain-containing protein [Azonexus sp.]|nr:helix-turn-helix domain-containing protein [Azonexus sp.]
MSVRTMARVWEFSKNKGNDLLMLLAIADFADDDGNAYPAVPTLAAKCRMKPRNANLILAALRASGELEVRQNEGPRGANRYRIVLPVHPLQNPTGVQKSTGMQKLTRTPVETYPKPLQISTDEPSVNRQEPSDGAQALSVGISKAKKDEITLAQFLDHCKASGEKSIPEDDPVWEYAQKVGIDNEMIAIAWLEFKGYWLNGEGKKRRMKDWRQTFRNAVRDNRARLWFVREGEQAQWTTTGEQARRAAA